MAVYQKRNNELVEVPCDCGGGGGTSGGNIVISDAIDSTSSFTAASSKAVKTAYDHAGELVQSQLDNQESQLNVGIVAKVNNCIQDKIDSGQIGNGTGDVPASVLNRVNNNEVRSIKNETDITSLKTEVNTLKISVGNAAGFNTRITELEVKRTTDRSDIDNLQQTLTGYDALKAQVEANKSKLEAISSGGEGGGGTGGSLADIESDIAKLRQDVDQNTVNLSSTSSQAEKNKGDIEALGQLIGDLPTTTDVSTLSSRISKNASDIELLESAINDLSGGSFSELAGMLEDINQTIESSNSAIDGLRTQITEVSNVSLETKSEFNQFKSETFGDVLTQIETLDTQISTNAAGLADAKSRLTSVESQLSGITDNISDLGGFKEEAETSLADLTSRIETLEIEVAENKEDIKELKERFDALEEEITGISNEVSQNTDTIDSLSKSFDESISQINEEISGNFAAVATLSDSVDANVSRINEALSANTTNIGDLSSSMTSIFNSLQDVIGRLSLLEGSMDSPQQTYKDLLNITEGQESQLPVLGAKLNDGGIILVSQ